MPRSEWYEDENLSRFGRFLRDWFFTFRPTKNVNQFAEETGFRAPTIWKWMRGEAAPDANSLQTIASRTNIPLLKLYEAAGYLERRDALVYLEEQIQTDMEFLDETRRAHLLLEVRDIRQRYEVDHPEDPGHVSPDSQVNGHHRVVPAT